MAWKTANTDLPLLVIEFNLKHLYILEKFCS